MTATPITYRWPRSWLPRTAGFFPLSGASISISRYTGAAKMAVGAATPWVARLDFSPIVESDGERDWKKVRALLMRVSGTGHRLALFDPTCIYPRGIAAGIHWGNIRVPGTGQFSDATLFSDGTGFREGATTARLARNHLAGETDVLIEGLVASQANSLVVGDAMEICGFMHSVLATVASNAAGQTLAPIWPPLRRDALRSGVSGIVNFEYPTSPFVNPNPNFAGFDVERPSRAPLGLNLVEDLSR